MKKEKKLNIKHYQPPVLAQWLLKASLNDLDHQQLCGDYEEAFQSMVPKDGYSKASRWYWRQVIKSIPTYVGYSILGGGYMIKNYFKVAVRSIFRNKLFAGVNISGLAIGMAVSVLSLLWVQNELSYEDIHINKDDIYRVAVKAGKDGKVIDLARSPVSLGPALKSDFPEIENSTRLLKSAMPFKYGDQEAITIPNCYFADPDIVDIFTFNKVSGEIEGVLTQKHSILISQSVAKIYFGNESPVGKILLAFDAHNLIIKGVFEDFPNTTDFPIDIIATQEYLYDLGFPREQWDNTNNSIYNYVKVKSSANITDLNNKISGLIKKHVPESEKTIYLQSFKDIHLHSSHMTGDISGLGDYKYIIIMSAMALFVLLIACFNFITLTTAKSMDRSVEIGVRKVIGANRNNLIRQFFTESSVIALIAFMLAVLLINLILPEFNNLAGKSLSLNPIENTSIIVTSP